MLGLSLMAREVHCKMLPVYEKYCYKHDTLFTLSNKT